MDRDPTRFGSRKFSSSEGSVSRDELVEELLCGGWDKSGAVSPASGAFEPVMLSVPFVTTTEAVFEAAPAGVTSAGAAAANPNVSDAAAARPSGSARKDLVVRMGASPGSCRPRWSTPYDQQYAARASSVREPDQFARTRPTSTRRPDEAWSPSADSMVTVIVGKSSGGRSVTIVAGTTVITTIRTV